MFYTVLPMNLLKIGISSGNHSGAWSPFASISEIINLVAVMRLLLVSGNQPNWEPVPSSINTAVFNGKRSVVSLLTKK